MPVAVVVVAVAVTVVLVTGPVIVARAQQVTAESPEPIHATLAGGSSKVLSIRCDEALARTSRRVAL